MASIWLQSHALGIHTHAKGAPLSSFTICLDTHTKNGGKRETEYDTYTHTQINQMEAQYLMISLNTPYPTTKGAIGANTEEYNHQFDSESEAGVSLTGKNSHSQNSSKRKHFWAKWTPPLRLAWPKTPIYNVEVLRSESV